MRQGVDGPQGVDAPQSGDAPEVVITGHAVADPPVAMVANDFFSVDSGSSAERRPTFLDVCAGSDVVLFPRSMTTPSLTPWMRQLEMPPSQPRGHLIPRNRRRVEIDGLRCGASLCKFYSCARALPAVNS